MGRPCEAPPTQDICLRGVRGPARRMESSPAPGSLWFLSPAGKELVRPQTHETPPSSPLNPARVPPPSCLRSFSYSPCPCTKKGGTTRAVPPSFSPSLQQLNMRRLAHLHHILRPERRLYLAYMRFAQEVYAHPTLPNAAADRLRQLARAAAPPETAASPAPRSRESLTDASAPPGSRECPWS